MNYDQTTRKALYESFRKNHQPGIISGLLGGSNSKDIFEVFTLNSYEQTSGQRQLFEKVCHAIDGYQGTPSQFFKGRYPKLVRFCAGSRNEEALLYTYFDKLNQFPYSTGWARRTVRTDTYLNPVAKIRNILYASYHLQMYGTTLDKYLLNEMSDELVDYKTHQRSMEGVADIIAAHLDAGDIAVKEALAAIITGENNIAFLTVEMIRGIFRSNDQELHQLLGQLLVAARLQEGVRQAICENMDCGTIDAFRTLFQVIEENGLCQVNVGNFSSFF